MREIKITTNDDSIVSFNLGGSARRAPHAYLIGTFGAETSGKTWLGLTGREVVGIVPMEYKSYATIEKAEAELGKSIARPSDPEAIIVNPRKQRAMENDTSDKGIERVRAFYRGRVERVKDTVYGLLENEDVGTLVIDPFGQWCKYVEFACEGPQGKYVKIGKDVRMDKSQSRQEIIDFLQSLNPFGKPVILTHRRRDEYVKNKATGRDTWEGFNYLGNHTNIIVEHVVNPKWDPDDADEDWQFGLNIRECQKRPELKGPEGQLCLTDGMVTLAGLIMLVDPEADLDRYM